MQHCLWPTVPLNTAASSNSAKPMLITTNGACLLQKLVEAKLKRAWLEGAAARAAALGQVSGDVPLLTAAPDSDTDRAGAARADANMIALLEEVELEDEEYGLAVPACGSWQCSNRSA